MKRYVPFQLVPETLTEETRQQLGCRMAEIHADYVCGKIRQMSCSPTQKQQILEAVIQNVKKASV